jgi:hypothetical protein
MNQSVYHNILAKNHLIRVVVSIIIVAIQAI